MLRTMAGAAARRWLLLIALLLPLFEAPLAPLVGQPPPTVAALGLTTWYFAEGYTGTGFDEYLTILNPNGSPASVTITYYFDNSEPEAYPIVVNANARKTVTVHVAGEGIGRGRNVGARLQSTNGVGIIVERPIYFTYAGVTDGHIGVGATALSTTWYFAEGYTAAGFDEFLTILNPNGSPASVTITYFLEGGGTVVKGVGVGAQRRRTVAVHSTSEGVGRDQAVSARVDSTIGVVVERPMYFTYTGGRGGGHNGLGATSTATDWFFAEGYTGGGFDEYLTILNPSGTPAAIRIIYFLLGGGSVVKTLTANANARTTVTVHDPYLGLGRNRQVATRVESTNGVGVVVERPMYFNYGSGYTGGHNAVGATAANTDWYFAEGYTAAGFDQYLTILNPFAGTATIQITYFLENGSTIGKSLAVAGGARQTVTVHDPGLGVGRGYQVAARVLSTNGVGIIVERPMYFNYAGRINGGHNAVGVPLGTASLPPPGPPVGPSLIVGSGGYSTINAAIAAAAPGSTIRIRAGTYAQQVEVNKTVTLEPFGDGAVWIDAGCARENGIRITQIGAVVSALGVKRSIDAGVLIDGQGLTDLDNVTVQNMTIQDFDCRNTGPEFRAGIGAWYAGGGQRILGNVITRRVELGGGVLTGGQSNGIWFKNSTTEQSQGGHQIIGNTIKGVYDGIGGETEDDPRGGYDRNTLIQGNTIDICYDDGISVEGGTQNVRVVANTITRCAIGISNAPNLTGPFFVEGNVIRNGVAGFYGNIQCFKLGDGGRGVAYYTGNLCNLSTSPSSTGWGQTNPGMNPIVARNNQINVTRYVIEIGPPGAGTSFDGDCLWSSDTTRFVEYNNSRYLTIAAFRAATGNEASGVQSPSCAP